MCNHSPQKTNSPQVSFKVYVQFETLKKKKKEKKKKPYVSKDVSEMVWNHKNFGQLKGLENFCNHNCQVSSDSIKN